MIYIWGLGFFYKINEFRLKEFEIAGYIDNKKALEMSEYKGKPLIKSADINSNMTVLVMSKNFVSMVYELIEKKVKKIIIGTYIFPDSGQYSGGIGDISCNRSDLIERRGKCNKGRIIKRTWGIYNKRKKFDF